MEVKRPKICAVITNNDLEAISDITPLVDMFEVRIDLIGTGWTEVVKSLRKPWLACNRIADEGGSWQGSESARVAELVRAVGLGAAIVDVELGTGNLEEVVKQVKPEAKCLISYHGLKGTPAYDVMKSIVRAQLNAGADICKVVTTATKFEDNLSVLQIIKDFPNVKVVAFVMGQLGLPSRVLCPLVGGDFMYASIESGRESAPGQITVRELRQIYRMLKND